MADEGFEPPYHVPQQSRRHKLRVNNHLQPNLYLSSFYDSSLISSDLINLHRQSTTTNYNSSSSSSSLIKAEGNIHLMSFIGNHNNNNIYSPDPPLAIPLNPNSIHQHHINIATTSTTAAGPYYNNNNNYDRSVVVVDDQSFHHHNGKQVINHTNTTTGQQNCLSLSLSSHHNNNTSTLELNLPSGYGINNKYQGVELTRSTVPLGPFTGYASVLNGSRFLKPAHQLLEEICQVGRGIYGNNTNNKDEDEEQESCNLLETAIVEQGFVDSSSSSCIDVAEQTRKKSGLLSLLQEVFKRYKMYYQQVQAVVASFESVAGLSNAAPFANLALKALTKHFKGLKDAITDQLQFATKSHGKMNYEREEAFTQRGENAGKGPFSQRSFQNVGFADQPVWRPQRGLPERAVTVLRAWLFEHFLHPYPTDTDKLMLAKQTGLSRNQVSNWFINARVRLWKPMVEEIHTLETRQGEKLPQRDEPPPNRPNEHLPSNTSFECENTSSSIQRMGEFTLKRNREDLIENLGGSEGHTNLPYENLTHHPHFTSNAGGSNVSLTLGLHQNGVGLAESYPMNAARRFGLDSHGEDYVLSGFGGQNRQFGRNIMG